MPSCLAARSCPVPLHHPYPATLPGMPLSCPHGDKGVRLATQLSTGYKVRRIPGVLKHLGIRRDFILRLSCFFNYFQQGGRRLSCSPGTH